MRGLIYCILFCLVLVFSCSKKDDHKKHPKYSPETVPSMIGYDDTIVFSDSGRIQFKVMASEIIVFDKAKDPYTLFPNKAYMEQYDSLMHIETKLWADSVWNYSKQKLWKLRGNVRIEKNDGKVYESEELFWDENNDKVYSNKQVMIHEPNKATIRALKFESNQAMTSRTFYSSRDGEIYISDSKDANGKENEDENHKK